MQGLFSSVKMVLNYGLWLQAERKPAEYTEEQRELCKAYFLVQKWLITTGSGCRRGRTQLSTRRSGGSCARPILWCKKG